MASRQYKRPDGKIITLGPHGKVVSIHGSVDDVPTPPPTVINMPPIVVEGRAPSGLMAFVHRVPPVAWLAIGAGAVYLFSKWRKPKYGYGY